MKVGLLAIAFAVSDVMVSNLMVVLCGERDTQPVLNTGTLYQ